MLVIFQGFQETSSNLLIYPPAMVSKLDESVGKVVKALKDREVLENTVVVFISDNGGMTTGMHGNSASNHPFRGVSPQFFS